MLILSFRLQTSPVPWHITSPAYVSASSPRLAMLQVLYLGIRISRLGNTARFCSALPDGLHAVCESSGDIRERHPGCVKNASKGNGKGMGNLVISPSAPGRTAALWIPFPRLHAALRGAGRCCSFMRRLCPVPRYMYTSSAVLSQKRLRSWAFDETHSP